MVTLQDLKDKIIETENDLLISGETLSEIPLQKDISDNFDTIDIEIFKYLGSTYAVINLK